MQNYTVLIDFSGTVRYDVKANSFEDAYEQVKTKHENCKTISTNDICEEYYYVESENGDQEEF